METKHLRVKVSEKIAAHNRTVPSQSLTVKEYLRIYGNKPNTYSLYEIGVPNTSADDVDPLLAAQEAKRRTLELQQDIMKRRKQKMELFEAQKKKAQEGTLTAANVNEMRKAMGNLGDYLKTINIKDEPDTAK